MSAEMMEMKESQEAQRNQELLERSNHVMDGAFQLLAELDGVSEADVREKLAEEVSRPTEMQQFMERELERVKENLRTSLEGDKSAQVSFGQQTVEIRCKTTDVKNAMANNHEIAAKNRAKELARMMENERKKEEEKKAKQEQERREQQKKAK